jgi:hypothetical protein
MPQHLGVSLKVAFEHIQLRYEQSFEIWKKQASLFNLLKTPASL